MMQEKDAKHEALKEKDEAVELKTASKNGRMQVALVDDKSHQEKLEKPVVDEISEKSASSSSHINEAEQVNHLEEASSSPKKSSHGMLRHRITLGLTAFVALTALTLNAFDLRSLISQNGKIDRNFVFTSSEDTTHPYLDPYNAGAELRENMIPKLQVGFGKQLIGFADARGEMVLPAKYEFAKNFSDGLAAVKEVGAETKWGFINHKGEYVIPPVYSSINSFHNGYALVMRDREVQVIDKNGKSCSPAGAREVGILDKGFYVFKDAHNSLWGLGKGHNVLIPPRHLEVNVIPTECATTVFSSDRLGFYDMFPEELPDAEVFFELSNKGSLSLADKNGKILFTKKFDKIQSAGKGHAQIGLDHKVGFVDLMGKEVIAPEYDEASAYDDLIAVRNDAKVSFIDAAGKPLKTAEVDNIVLDPGTQKWLHDGLGIFKRGKLYGYMDSHGKEVIAPKFAQAHFFKDGLARVSDGNRLMFIDVHGNVAGGKTFTSAQAFSDGHANVGVAGPLYTALEDFPRTLLNVSKPNNLKNDTESKPQSSFENGEF